jgi:hypothetical protein
MGTVNQEKQCNVCGNVKPLSDFPKDKRLKDGRRSQCTDCTRKRVAKHREENKDRLNEESRAYYQQNRDAVLSQKAEYRQVNREALNQASRDYYAENRPRILDQKRQYRAENAEAISAKEAEWYKANRDKVSEKNARYRAERPDYFWRADYRRRMKRFGHVPTVVVEFTKADVIAAHGDACWHCGGEFEELDHFPVHVAAAGPHCLDNVRPSCITCNRARTGLDM